MNQSPAYILAQYLIDEAAFTDPSAGGDWPLYVGALPDGDNVDHDVAALVDTAPVKDGRLMSGTPMFHYGVQLLLRASDYNTGYAKADAIATLLAAVDDDDVAVDSNNTYTVVSITQTTGVVVMGQEEGTKRREMFSVNFLATLKEV